MSLPNGHYITANGSEMWVNGGRSRVDFDWFEEAEACCDCQPEAYADSDGYLVWYCDQCGGGKAKLLWEGVTTE